MKLIPTRLLAGVAIVALAASACSSSGASPTPAPATPAPGTPAPNATPAPTGTPAPVTINWWHITTGEPGKTIFQGIADAYTAAHPNVTIKITVLENEAFKTKLATETAVRQPA